MEKTYKRYTLKCQSLINSYNEGFITGDKTRDKASFECLSIQCTRIILFLSLDFIPLKDNHNCQCNRNDVSLPLVREMD